MGKSHPRKWELDAQSVIRALRLPLPPHDFALLGKVDSVVVAASKFEVTPNPDVASEARGWVYSLCVTSDYQGRGLGGALLDETVEAMKVEARQLGRTDLLLACKAHERNAASRAMLTASGWELVEDSKDSAGEHYDAWSALVAC